MVLCLAAAWGRAHTMYLFIFRIRRQAEATESWLCLHILWFQLGSHHSTVVASRLHSTTQIVAKPQLSKTKQMRRRFMWKKIVVCSLLGLWVVVSEPDPRKIEKEGLVNWLGWKCRLRPVCRGTSDVCLLEILTAFFVCWNESHSSEGYIVKRFRLL